MAYLLDANDCCLSIRRCKEVVCDAIEHAAPREIPDDLTALEVEIQKGLDDLMAMFR